MNQSLPAFAVLLALGLGTSTEAAPLPVQKPSALRDAEFEKLWNNIDCYQPDAVKFWCRVQADPKAGYAFLDRKIEPIQLNEATAKRLIDDLGSDDESTWNAAAARLKVRDVRLAMNFLDAWDYAKTDLKRKRLLPLVFNTDYSGYLENLGFYDVTLKQHNAGPGQPIYYSIRTALRPNVPQDVCLALKLHGSCEMGIGVDSLTTPDQRKTRPENAVAPYLDGHLLARLAQGHPAAEPAKSLLASSTEPNRLKCKSLGGSFDAGQLPMLWETWFSGTPDCLTKQLLRSPELSVAFLRSKMKPVQASPLRVGLLLTLLAHPDDDVWDRAAAQLEKADPRLCLPLDTLWWTAHTWEQRRRLALLICPSIPNEKSFDYKINRYTTGNREWVAIEYRVRPHLAADEIPVDYRDEGRSGGAYVEDTPKGVSRAKWNREEAAIWVLEAIGTEAALAIVERMATGHPDAGPTIAAKEVLARRIRN